MIFETISALLAAVSIMFSRLNRHHDDAMSTADLRSSLIQLDSLLEKGPRRMAKQAPIKPFTTTRLSM